MKVNRKFWTEFIELYQSLPVLWRVKSDEYSNRNLKAMAYEKMIKKLKEIEPDADRNMVIRKINTFRSNYRRDSKKYKQSRESSAGADDLFQSTLWYYGLLGFLENQEDYLEERSTVSNNELADESSNTSGQSKKRKSLSKEDNYVKRWPCNNLKETDDDAATMAKVWSLEYKQLSYQQKIFTRKIISDVFFNGYLQRLNEDTVRKIEKIFDKKERNSTPVWSDESTSSSMPREREGCFVKSEEMLA